MSLSQAVERENESDWAGPTIVKMYRRGTNIWLALIETNVTALLFGCRVRFLSTRIMGDRNNVNNRLTLDYLMSSNQLREYNRSRSPWQIRFQLTKKSFRSLFCLLYEEPSKLEGSVPWHYPEASLFFSIQLKLTLITTTRLHSRVSLAPRASLDNTSRLLDCAVLVVYKLQRVQLPKVLKKISKTLRDG